MDRGRSERYHRFTVCPCGPAQQARVRTSALNAGVGVCERSRPRPYLERGKPKRPPPRRATRLRPPPGDACVEVLTQQVLYGQRLEHGLQQGQAPAGCDLAESPPPVGCGPRPAAPDLFVVLSSNVGLRWWGGVVVVVELVVVVVVVEVVVVVVVVVAELEVVLGGCPGPSSTQGSLTGPSVLQTSIPPYSTDRSVCPAAVLYIQSSGCTAWI
ncbi:unnamed protein product [Gadus morhua 'NCC']